LWLQQLEEAEMLPFLNEEQVRAELRMVDLIPAMRTALIEFSAGRVSQPARQMLSVEPHGGYFGTMPAAGTVGLGAKLVTFYPGNTSHHLPTHNALIVLFRPETGEPLAVMDGRLITEMRTAAVSAVATQTLAVKDAKVLAVLGSGVQARSHVEALRLVRDFEEIRVWSRTPEHAERFARTVGANTMGAEQAVRGADVIVTATSAREAVLKGSWLKQGAHVNSVGWPGPQGRELDDETMRNLLVVDTRETVLKEAGDVLLSGAEIHAELGEVLAGAKPVLPEVTTIFKSVGMAVEDVAAAKLVYQRESTRP
jgi:ornithine cyclodeaminase/alanine dehydrogenase-like protein (mu-crystallin family)